jgi:hypothetical protein
VPERVVFDTNILVIITSSNWANTKEFPCSLRQSFLPVSPEMAFALGFLLGTLWAVIIIYDYCYPNDAAVA